MSIECICSVFLNSTLLFLGLYCFIASQIVQTCYFSMFPCPIILTSKSWFASWNFAKAQIAFYVLLKTNSVLFSRLNEAHCTVWRYGCRLSEARVLTNLKVAKEELQGKVSSSKGRGRYSECWWCNTQPPFIFVAAYFDFDWRRDKSILHDRKQQLSL